MHWHPFIDRDLFGASRSIREDVKAVQRGL
jgi:hypothetical protein